MRQALLAFGPILLLVSCDRIQAPVRDAPRSLPQPSANVSTSEVAEALLSLTQEWVDTWNRRDIERMAQMHGDVANTAYVIGETSSTVEWLLQEIRDKNFWNLSWKLAVLKPHVRVLGPDAGLVSFRLVGEETGVGGTKLSPRHSVSSFRSSTENGKSFTSKTVPVSRNPLHPPRALVLNSRS